MMKFNLYVSCNQNRSGEYTEVRRVNLDINKDLTNFACLRDKLCTIFPALQVRTYSLTWKDGKTAITIASNEELKIALEDMGPKAKKNNNMYNLYIYVWGDNVSTIWQQYTVTSDNYDHYYDYD